MERKRFDEMNCGIARALEALGDKWTLLIVRDRRSQRRVPRLRLRDADGRPLARRDLRMVIGPGATEETITRFHRPPTQGLK